MAAAPAAQHRFDAIAVIASGLCVVHCLLLPLLLLLVPVMATWLALPESFHRWMLAVAIPTSVIALVLGQRRHRRWTPLAAAIPATVVLAVGALLIEAPLLETVLTVCGATILVLAHLVNGRLPNARHA
jgi:hypothetical protein